MTLIPAGHGKAFRLKTGQKLKVINTYGEQAVDFWAFDSSNLFHSLSVEISRRVWGRIRPQVGDTIYTNYREGIICITEDTSNGIHDTLIAPCDPATYEKFGSPKDHRSCASNLHESLSEIGERLPYTPGAINLFTNIPVTENLYMTIEPSLAKPGDYVVIEALMDAIVVLSACPCDIVPINAPDCGISDINVERI